MDNFKSGFVTVIGRPNVGKSTLINSIVGQKVAIVSNKPQTTRNKITAIYADDVSQIVFVDTPGIHTPKNKLGAVMVKSAYSALSDMDAVVFMVDASKDITDENIIKRLQTVKVPMILAINKIDIVPKEKLLGIIAKYSGLCSFDEVIPISAQKKDGVKLLVDTIRKFLPYGPKYYPDDQVTDQPERQIVSEMIREKILRFLLQEVPHGTAVEITAMKNEKDICRINATIYVEKPGHKLILIGKGGEMIKKIGTSARIEIEKFLDKKVHLELWVKVKDDWRNNEAQIRNFGFKSE
ncbi:MAG: GTPase Era [Clostridia bacterium]|nr:GTPase Era [Clostridia bacterium]